MNSITTAIHCQSGNLSNLYILQDKQLTKSIYILFLLLPSILPGQGFDWQGSTRLPAKYPKMFIGAYAAGTYSNHTGAFNFIEANNVCCPYESGTGFGFKAGAAAEYWHTGNIAFSGALVYSSLPVVFSSISRDAVGPGKYWEIQYESDINLSYAGLYLSGKYRLPATHIHIGAGMQIAYLVAESSSHIMRSLSPEFPFSDSSYVVNLKNGRIPELNDLIIVPSLKIGYDLNLGFGTYASPSLNISYPLLNVAKDEDWRRITYSLELIILTGLY